MFRSSTRGVGHMHGWVVQGSMMAGFLSWQFVAVNPSHFAPRREKLATGAGGYAAGFRRN